MDGLKAGTAAQLLVHRREEQIVEVPHGSTALADEVVVWMPLFDLVVGAGAGKMRLGDQIKADEQLEGAIDGREVDLGHRFVERANDILRTEVRSACA